LIPSPDRIPSPWIPLSHLPHNHTDGDIDPDGAKATGNDSGPVLALLARGLELWLRQQCEAIEAVEIHLEGSALKLLRGRLEGVRLSARGVIYQAMEIERVELRSDGLRVRMGPLLRHQRRGTGESLSDSGPGGSERRGGGSLPPFPPLAGPRQGSGPGPAGGVIPAGSGDPPRPGAAHGHHRRHHRCQTADQTRTVEASISAVEGTVELRSLDGAHTLRLPMDSNIQIHAVSLREGRLELTGEASVLP
jgi:hypothetical protein